MDILKKIFAVFSWLGMTILGMMGGQGKIGGKSTRRFALPTLATGFAVGWDGFRWTDLAYLLFIPVLSMGYGENSIIATIGLHIEWLIRVVYALLLSIPFAFSGLTRWIISAIMLVIAFSIHAGTLGNTSWFGDFLVEDMIRYGTLASLVLLCTIWRKK